MAVPLMMRVGPEGAWQRRGTAFHLIDHFYVTAAHVLCGDVHEPPYAGASFALRTVAVREYRLDFSADLALLIADTGADLDPTLELGMERPRDRSYWKAVGFPDATQDAGTHEGRRPLDGHVVDFDHRAPSKAITLFVNQNTSDRDMGMSGAAVTSNGAVIGVVTSVLSGGSTAWAASADALWRLHTRVLLREQVRRLLPSREALEALAVEVGLTTPLCTKPEDSDEVCALMRGASENGQQRFTSLLEHLSRRDKLFAPFAERARAITESLAVDGAVRGVETIGQSKHVAEAVKNELANFKTAESLLARLRAYKNLHDVLHRMRSPLKALKAQGKMLSANGTELTERAAELRDVLRTSPPLGATHWVDEIVAKASVVAAVPDGAPLPGHALGTLERRVFERLVVLNAELFAVAKCEPLQALGSAVRGVRSAAARASLPPGVQARIEDALAGIEHLDIALRRLVDQHDVLQDAEKRIRDALAGASPEALEDLNHVFACIEALTLESHDIWLTSLASDTLDLKQVFAEARLEKSLQQLTNFQQRLERAFLQTDQRLKDFCGRLTPLIVPLMQLRQESANE